MYTASGTCQSTQFHVRLSSGSGAGSGISASLHTLCLASLSRPCAGNGPGWAIRARSRPARLDSQVQRANQAAVCRKHLLAQLPRGQVRRCMPELLHEPVPRPPARAHPAKLTVEPFHRHSASRQHAVATLPAVRTFDRRLQRAKRQASAPALQQGHLKEQKDGACAGVPPLLGVSTPCDHPNSAPSSPNTHQRAPR